MSFKVVIPARYASTRLPGKPLADIAGQPMIVRVARQALASGAAEVVVATDDPRIVEVVADAGLPVTLTRADHTSGSDRVMEVVNTHGWGNDEVVLNVQGDEPLIPPAVISQLADCMLHQRSVAAATLCEPITRREILFDPNVVKVVRDDAHNALYFSRAPIPYDRDGFGHAPALEAGATDGGDASAAAPLKPGTWWRHVGVYAYRVRALTRFVQLPPGRMEVVESLEQLRLLENGMKMCVVESAEPVPGGVDTPADLDRVRRQFG